MLRLLSAAGMGAMFLVISPPLRTKLTDQLALGVRTMDINAPYSYIGGGVLLLLLFLTSLYRGAQAR